MGDYELLDLSFSRKWRDLLQRLPIEQQDIYFTPEYYSLYERNGEGKALCFIYSDNSEVALYPFLLNEITFPDLKFDQKYYDIQGAYGYNGVITSTYNESFIQDFYTAFAEYATKNNIVAEFTRFHPLLRNHTFSEKNLQTIFDRKTVYLNLQKPYKEIFGNFQTTTRKQIRRAENRYKLEIRVYRNDLSQLDTFMKIYHETMERVHSIEYLFFNRNYFQSLVESTNNICLVALFEGKPVAVIIALVSNFYIHGHLGGALTDSLSMSPTSILYSEMIRYGQMLGCKFLHVGGGATVNEDDPLFQFKKNFSGTTADFYIGKKIYNPDVYSSLVETWEKRNPEKTKTYRNHILKYRY
jgi:lipid II:glycine glycyltransferase (peptidoglycan interpeptide bridge formation enzyme)